MRRAGMMVLALALGACGNASEVTPAERAAAERWVTHEQMPLSTRPVALWHASDLPNGLLCGEIEAPAMLRDKRATLRYLYDQSGKRPWGQIEMHEGMITFSAVTQSLIDMNRGTFDNLWATSCAPYAPLLRRIAATTGIDADALGVARQAPRARTAAELVDEIEARKRQVDEMEKALQH